jgi:hypothetical protein
MPGQTMSHLRDIKTFYDWCCTNLDTIDEGQIAVVKYGKSNKFDHIELSCKIVKKTIVQRSELQ